MGKDRNGKGNRKWMNEDKKEKQEGEKSEEESREGKEKGREWQSRKKKEFLSLLMLLRLHDAVLSHAPIALICLCYCHLKAKADDSFSNTALPGVNVSTLSWCSFESNKTHSGRQMKYIWLVRSCVHLPQARIPLSPWPHWWFVAPWPRVLLLGHPPSSSQTRQCSTRPHQPKPGVTTSLWTTAGNLLGLSLNICSHNIL